MINKPIMENFRAYKIHVKYIIGFLLLTIVVLISVRWSEQTKLVEYISFALTLSSLLLSVIAIVYSFISNGKVSESIGTLNNVSFEVLESSKKLNQISDNLTIKVDEIPGHLKKMESQTFKTQELIESMQRVKENPSDAETKNTIFDEEFVRNYMNKSSFSGKVLLYAISLSYLNKKSFNLIDLLGDQFDYNYGYFSSSVAMGLFSFISNEGLYTIIDINEILFKNIKDIAYETANSKDKNQSSVSLILYSWVSKLTETESYFNN